MVSLLPFEIDGKMAIGVTVELPNTRLLAISTDRGYIMCGALDVNLLNTRLADRGILAGRALGVRTLAELLEAPLADVTDAALKEGVTVGMSGRDALRRLF